MLVLSGNCKEQTGSSVIGSTGIDLKMFLKRKTTNKFNIIITESLFEEVFFSLTEW